MKIRDLLSEAELLAQLAEEAAELGQAALKLRRALDGTNPTPKSVSECREALREEYTDVLHCGIALNLSVNRKQIMLKNKRWENRLEKRTQKTAESDQEQAHGHWENWRDLLGVRCSMCGMWVIDPSPVCPNCGTIMDREVKFK